MAPMVGYQQFSVASKCGSRSNSSVPTLDTLPGLEAFEMTEDDRSYHSDEDWFDSPRELIPNWPQLAPAEEMDMLAEVSDNVQLTGYELVFGIDLSGRINGWNSKAMEMTGFARDDVIGCDFVSTFISLEVQMPLHQILEKAQVGEETIDFEFPFYTVDARCIQVLLTTVVRRNEAGEIVGTFCIGKKTIESELDSMSGQLVQ
jgi:PAS domain S-box-containing protein